MSAGLVDSWATVWLQYSIQTPLDSRLTLQILSRAPVPYARLSVPQYVWQMANMDSDSESFPEIPRVSSFTWCGLE